MQLKKTLGRIQANADKLFHGRLLLMSCRQHPSRHTDAAQGPSTPSGASSAIIECFAPGLLRFARNDERQLCTK
jgi:hypothetical protein